MYIRHYTADPHSLLVGRTATPPLPLPRSLACTPPSLPCAAGPRCLPRALVDGMCPCCGSPLQGAGCPPGGQTRCVLPDGPEVRPGGGGEQAEPERPWEKRECQPTPRSEEALGEETKRVDPRAILRRSFRWLGQCTGRRGTARAPGCCQRCAGAGARRWGRAPCPRARDTLSSPSRWTGTCGWRAPRG